VGRGFDEEPEAAVTASRAVARVAANATDRLDGSPDDPNVTDTTDDAREREAEVVDERGAPVARRTAERPGPKRLRLSADCESPGSRHWTPRQVAMTNLRTVVGRAYPRVTGLFRERSWVFSNPAAVPRDERLRLRLPRAPGAAAVHRVRRARGAMTAFWLNVIWMNGPAALVGEKPGQPRALLRRADAHHWPSSSGWPSAGL